MRIEVRGLVVFRGSYPAVQDVGFTVEGGGWMGLVGANGSGKTSLLRALAGWIDLQEGTILVDGVDRTGDRGWRARAIGFAPDAAALPSSLSGGELFAILGGDEIGLDSGDPIAPLRRALAFDSFLDLRIDTLSTGMRQRLAIFCAFLARPQAVILDEPFNWLDPICAFDTKAALATLADGGLTLITALHEMNALVHHCRSGLLLSEGRVSRRLDEDALARGARDYSTFEAKMIAGLRGGEGEP